PHSNSQSISIILIFHSNSNPNQPTAVLAPPSSPSATDHRSSSLRHRISSHRLLHSAKRWTICVAN
ncbi:hypothetical protein M8C21_027491, partial [Ambrosia artemisiifolia]